MKWKRHTDEQTASAWRYAQADKVGYRKLGTSEPYKLAISAGASRTAWVVLDDTHGSAVELRLAIDCGPRAPAQARGPREAA